jgi:hypothetical protein
MLPDVTIPISLAMLLEVFRPCFTAPTFRVFRALVVGMLAATSTFAGSCVAVGARHDVSASDNPVSSPDTRTVSVSSSLPADDTTPRPAVSTTTDGYTPVGFTAKVLLGTGSIRPSTSPILPAQEHFPICGHPTDDHPGESPRLALVGLPGCPARDGDAAGERTGYGADHGSVDEGRRAGLADAVAVLAAARRAVAAAQPGRGRRPGAPGCGLDSTT